MTLVEFPQVQYIDLSEMVHNLKAVAILTREHFLKLYQRFLAIFVVSHFLTFSSAKVYPKWDPEKVYLIPE